uniref:Neur_chan_LBD domain-containing protein n=1 Tax=Panagrellus redivivus TaxID=6233 RepID=A0A7E4UX14_PANRE
MRIFLLLLLVVLLQCVNGRRKSNRGNFDRRPGMGDARLTGNDLIFEDDMPEATTIAEEVGQSKPTEVETNDVTDDSDEKEDEKDVGTAKAVEALFNFFTSNTTENDVNITEIISGKDEFAKVPTDIGIERKQVFWIDASYKATDNGINITTLPECIAWQNFWLNNDTIIDPKLTNDTNSSNSDELNLDLVEYELIETKKRAKALNLSTDLFDEYKAIGILFKEVCGDHEREFWYTSTEDARNLGIDEYSPICDPFKEELNPNAKKLAALAALLNEIIHNRTQEAEIDLAYNATDTLLSAVGNGSFTEEELEIVDGQNSTEIPHGVILRLKRKAHEESTEDDKKEDREGDDEDWLEDIKYESKEILSVDKHLLDKLDSDNASAIPMEKVWIQIDATDEAAPKMYLLSAQAAEMLQLPIPEHHFQRFEKVVLFLPGICSDYVPTAIDAFNASDFEGITIDGPIGVNITALEVAGVNLTELAEKLRNDTEVDEILLRTNGSTRTLGGSYILPVLQKNQYDPFSAPIVFQGSAVAVRFGIYIESMSNFQTSTMDYDMDISLLMAWRDARLVNPYDKPILVKEEEILEKIWRPDPFFANAKEAEFHEVTFLNFLMRIFNDGLVLYETRVKLKPACNLILCKYPHDKQTCELLIKSFAYPVETVRFEWFTRKYDAIDKNPEVKLPELYIDRYEPTLCNKTRKSGEFSCIRAVFRLKRDVGFHIAQTYIPTSLALMFSWVGVWLPKEFMEGRIGVAITVLLTLSTESAGAREHLPSVSYLKASNRPLVRLRDRIRVLHPPSNPFRHRFRQTSQSTPEMGHQKATRRHPRSQRYNA